MCCVSWIQIYNTGGPNLTAHQPVRVQMCGRNPQEHSSDLPSTLDRWPMSGVTFKRTLDLYNSTHHGPLGHEWS